MVKICENHAKAESAGRSNSSCQASVRSRLSLDLSLCPDLSRDRPLPRERSLCPDLSLDRPLPRDLSLERPLPRDLSLERSLPRDLSRDLFLPRERSRDFLRSLSRSLCGWMDAVLTKQPLQSFVQECKCNYSHDNDSITT